MPKFYCLHAYDVSCYSQPFCVEAESQEQAEDKLDAMLDAGCFDNVPGEPAWSSTDNMRWLLVNEIKPGTPEPEPPEKLEGFRPIPEKGNQNA